MGLKQARCDVSGLVRSRASFDAIEDRIDEIPGLDDQERAALWLLHGRVKAADGSATLRTSSWSGSRGQPLEEATIQAPTESLVSQS